MTKIQFDEKRLQLCARAPRWRLSQQLLRLLRLSDGLEGVEIVAETPEELAATGVVEVPMMLHMAIAAESGQVEGGSDSPNLVMKG